MKTMLFYLTALYKSFTDIAWIRSQKNNFARASVFAAGLFLVLSLIESAVVTQASLSGIRQTMTDLRVKAPDLRIEINNGALSVSGVEQPFVYTLADETDSVLLYIDSTVSSTAVTPASLEQAKDKNVMIVTSDAIQFADAERVNTSKTEISSIPASAIPTGDTMQRIIDMTQSPRIWIMVFAVLALVLFIFNSIAVLLYLVFVAGIVYIAARWQKRAWTFTQLYTVALFVLPLPLLLGDILPIFGFRTAMVDVAILFALLFAVVFWDKGEVEPAPEQEA